MNFLREAVSILAYGAIVFSIVEIYLTLNKLWSRKHIQEVADSISISARVIGCLYAINAKVSKKALENFGCRF